MKHTTILFLLFVILLPSCAKRQTADNFYFGAYSEAEALFNRQEYEKAIQKYQAYIDENPEGNLAVISRYYIARSYAALGRKDEAEVIFKKIIKEHPDLVWANFSESQLRDLKEETVSAKK